VCLEGNRFESDGVSPSFLSCLSPRRKGAKNRKNFAAWRLCERFLPSSDRRRPHRLDSRISQRVGALRDRAAGRDHVVNQQNMRVTILFCDARIASEGAFQILTALFGAERRLRRRAADFLEQSRLERNLQQRTDSASHFFGLIESSLAQTRTRQ